MGLSIEVGLLAQLLEEDEEGKEWLEQSLERVNQLLEANQLPRHEEAEIVDQNSRAALISFPYSFIHYLRRAYVRRKADSTWVASPLAATDDPGKDPLLREEYEVHMASHLVCHSDAEGFYVPVDFRDILFGDEDFPGGMLGSSQQLMRELIMVAPALGVRLEDGRLSDQEADRVNSSTEEEGGLDRELSAWILLFEAARISIEQRTAIVFT